MFMHKVGLDVVAHLFLCECVCRVCVCTSTWGAVCTDLHVPIHGRVHAHACTGVKECVPGMAVCALLWAVNVPVCALWASGARKSQRQQLAERVMTCL